VLHESTREIVNGIGLMVHRFRDPRAVPSGMTALLLHGFMDAGATWDLVAAPLAARGHDVVAPDLRGFGASDRVGADGYYHFPDYVADVAALVDRLSPPRLAVVGHSMGGTVAALYAGALPERVDRLALLEGVGPMGSVPSHAVDRMRAWLRGASRVDRVQKPIGSLDDAVRRLAVNHPLVPADVLRTRAELLATRDGEGRYAWSYDPLHRTTAPMPFYADAFRAFLREIRCPTLFVGGGPQGYHPDDEDERLACIASVERVDLPGAGHMLHWTAPLELARLLDAFFRAGEAPFERNA
jgi:pimeloyl-ACP methyl ester carboxylesterase